jgi:LysM repeat protein
MVHNKKIFVQLRIYFSDMHLCFRDVRRSEGCRTVHPQCTLQAAFLVSATFAGRTLLGRTESSASSPVKRLLPFAAVPAAAAGLAVAFTIGNSSGAPVADEVTGHSTTTSNATTDIQSPKTASSTPVVSLTHHAGTGLPIVKMDSAMVTAIQAKGRHHRTQSAKYTVKSGDTLASIAKSVYANADYWPVLYWANHAAIPYASQITAGQVLSVPNKPAKIPSAPQEQAPAATTMSSGSAATSATTQTQTTQTTSTYSGSAGSFQACVIARESGGNPQVMNASGHYGLYQFSYSTWAAYGGNPADFGHASVAEQNQVFANAIAAGGESNWAPYDGC